MNRNQARHARLNVEVLETRIVPTTQYSFVDPGAQTNYDGGVVAAVKVANHVPYGGVVSLTAANLPSGLTMSDDGIVSGTLASDAGTNSPYTVTISGNDAITTAAESETITWAVNASPVSLTSPGDQTNYVSAIIALSVTSSDSLNNALSFAAKTGVAGSPPSRFGGLTKAWLSAWPEGTQGKVV